jgi:hypothetical protein
VADLREETPEISVGYGLLFYCHGSVNWRYAMELIISERIFYCVFSTFISACSVRAAGYEDKVDINYVSS